MVTEGRQNLETVIFDYLGALRDGNQEAVRAVLDPNVTWQGLHEDWVYHGPDEVIETLQEGLRLRRNVAALEFVRAGSRLVMGVRGPSLDEVGGEPLDGQIFDVFTLSEKSSALRTTGSGQRHSRPPRLMRIRGGDRGADESTASRPHLMPLCTESEIRQGKKRRMSRFQDPQRAVESRGETG